MINFNRLVNIREELNEMFVYIFTDLCLYITSDSSLVIFRNELKSPYKEKCLQASYATKFMGYLDEYIAFKYGIPIGEIKIKMSLY